MLIRFKNKCLFTQVLLPDKEIIHLVQCLHIKLLISRVCAFNNNQLVAKIRFIQHDLLIDVPIIPHSWTNVNNFRIKKYLLSQKQCPSKAFHFYWTRFLNVDVNVSMQKNIYITNTRQIRSNNCSKHLKHSALQVGQNPHQNCTS